MFARARKLHEAGILSMNKRNADYILMNNERKYYPLVDDKLKTKTLAEKAGLAVPPLYGVIRTEGDIGQLEDIIKNKKEFVVKPAAGAGGEGIIVIKGRVRGLFREANGNLFDFAELRHRILTTLSGVYSLGGQPDKVLVEYCVQFDPFFSKIAFQGIPDIRVIVYKGVPVMAMGRLPTRMSNGKANLHIGAIGAGIDIATGKTLNAVWNNQLVQEHPDTLEPVSGMKIPHWDRILDISAMTTKLTNLGYQGVDLVLDKEMGPLILELNARPGLNIQIANDAGLEPRLRHVDSWIKKSYKPQKCIEFAKENFAASKSKSLRS